MSKKEAGVNANDLIHRARLQVRNEVDDGLGGRAISYVDIGSIWCRVMMNGGQAFWEAKKINPKLTHFIIMRYRPGLTPRNRIVWSGRAFAFDSVDDPDGRRIELHAMATEILQYVS